MFIKVLTYLAYLLACCKLSR